jgi:hypothetical protein
VEKPSWWSDIVVRGMYKSNWGSFVEQWFFQQDYQDSFPSSIPWDSDS